MNQADLLSQFSDIEFPGQDPAQYGEYERESQRLVHLCQHLVIHFLTDGDIQQIDENHLNLHFPVQKKPDRFQWSKSLEL